MRKRIVGAENNQVVERSSRSWLNLDQIATVEVDSEQAGFPIEAAFAFEPTLGWRASEKGEQRIRIIFDEPVPLQRIQLQFHEANVERTQEFTLRWSSAQGGPPQEIVRQRWNFSPAGSTTEVENYAVELTAVSVLELSIQPEISGPKAFASLASWRLG